MRLSVNFMSLDSSNGSIGIGTDEFLAASDPLAIGQLTNEFIFLEDGDVAQISAEDCF